MTRYKWRPAIGRSCSPERGAEILRPTGNPATAAGPDRGQTGAETPVRLTYAPQKTWKIHRVPSMI